MLRNVNITLSICIPTYNRAKFIGETILSITSQASDNVEIVIVDGASTDNTEEVVNRFRNIFKNIVYYRRQNNMGVDRDMAKTVELASGEYCWLLSSDDVLKPGAIDRVLKEIKYKYDIYLCNMTGCSLSLVPTIDTYWLFPKVKDKVFNISDRDQLLEYFRCANWLGALFSYMSSIIFCRKKWCDTKYDDNIDGTCYGHVFRLFSFIFQECKLKYIREQLVFWRMGNDSFSHLGIAKRMLLDIDGYLLFAQRFFANDEQVKISFLRVMQKEHPWYKIIILRALINDDEEWNRIATKLLHFDYNNGVLTLCTKLGRHRKITLLALNLKEKVAVNIVRPVRRLSYNILKTYP